MGTGRCVPKPGERSKETGAREERDLDKAESRRARESVGTGEDLILEIRDLANRGGTARNGRNGGNA